MREPTLNFKLSGSTAPLNTPIDIGLIIGGNLVFTPAANANGAGYASFTFQVQDDGGGTNLDTVARTLTVNVISVNDAPIGANNTVTTNEDTAVSVVLSGADPDGDTITTMVVTQPQRGTLTGNPPNLTYTPNKDVNGTDSFSYKTNDGKLDSPLAIVTINITPVNDAPVLNVPGAQTVNEGQTLTFTLTATDVDAGQTITFSSSNLPQGATLNPATGAFSWKPSVGC